MVAVLNARIPFIPVYQTIRTGISVKCQNEIMSASFLLIFVLKWLGNHVSKSWANASALSLPAFTCNFCLFFWLDETNEKVVIRTCAKLTMDNQCGNFQFEDDLLRGCILTCDLDGCNSAKSLRYSYFSSLLPVLVSFFVVQTYIPWQNLLFV